MISCSLGPGLSKCIMRKLRRRGRRYRCGRMADRARRSRNGLGWSRARRCWIGCMTAILRLLRVMRRVLSVGQRRRVCYLAFPLRRFLLCRTAIKVADINADYHLHEFILALWGMPLGEMLDLEALSKKCHERGRWIFFFSSNPANCPGTSLSLLGASQC